LRGIDDERDAPFRTHPADFLYRLNGAKHVGGVRNYHKAGILFYFSTYFVGIDKTFAVKANEVV
jgi:hypothetical protein